MIGALLSAAVFQEVGFELVKNQTLTERMRRITPSNTTAMRDAICTGITLMLKLHTLINKLGTFQQYNFVHIVLTDGDDNASKLSLEETYALLLLIGKTIPVDQLKTIFIGVDIEQCEQAVKEMLCMTLLGLDNVDFHKIGTDNIENIFQQIRIKLGIID